MKKYNDKKSFFNAIGNKLILLLFFISALSTLLIASLVNYQKKNYETMVVEMTKNHLTSAVQALSNLISIDQLDLFHTPEDINRPEYRIIKNKLIKFSSDYHVKFAYFWRDHGNGKLQYIIDNDLNPETRVKPGDIEDIHDDVELEALKGNVGVTDLGSYSPDWEGLLSAVAPVRDTNGKIYCVAGVDIEDDFIITQRNDSRNMTALQLIVIPISIIFALINMLLYRRKAKQIEEAHDRLQYFNNNLRRAFLTYLSEEVLEEIVSDPSRLQLGGINRHMTAMFTDVKEFPHIAEGLKPEQMVDLLNYYLSTMSDIILEKKGTIDKYQGDAIISFFGAPLEFNDHALKACHAAIAMKRIETRSNKYIMEHKLSCQPLLTRIGINTGDMIVGNMGTERKMNYTIVSNAVNLASRIEKINKIYGTWILAPEHTIKETKDQFLTRKLDMVRLTGLNQPVRLFEILETKTEAKHILKEQINSFYESFVLFEQRKWRDAEKSFELLLKLFPDDGPSRLYHERSIKFQENPPAADWDGVFDFTDIH